MIDVDVQLNSIRRILEDAVNEYVGNGFSMPEHLYITLPSRVCFDLANLIPEFSMKYNIKVEFPILERSFTIPATKLMAMSIFGPFGLFVDDGLSILVPNSDKLLWNIDGVIQRGYEFVPPKFYDIMDEGVLDATALTLVIAMSFVLYKIGFERLADFLVKAALKATSQTSAIHTIMNNQSAISNSISDVNTTVNTVNSTVNAVNSNVLNIKNNTGFIAGKTIAQVVEKIEVDVTTSASLVSETKDEVSVSHSETDALVQQIIDLLEAKPNLEHLARALARYL